MSMKKNTAAFLRCVAESLDPQPPLDMAVQAKLVEVLSGEFGKGIVGRGFTSGGGTEVSY